MKYFGIAAALCMISGSPAIAQGSAEEGARKNSMCAGCHGIPGYRTAFPEVYEAPKLGGQHASYMVKALKAYQSGARNHPTMRAIAATLSDKDMADLAAYYSAVEKAPASAEAK
jgi:cytochrome c553